MKLKRGISLARLQSSKRSGKAGFENCSLYRQSPFYVSVLLATELQESVYKVTNFDTSTRSIRSRSIAGAPPTRASIFEAVGVPQPLFFISSPSPQADVPSPR